LTGLLTATEGLKCPSKGKKSGLSQLSAIGRRGVLALFFTEKAILNNPMLHNKAKYTQKGGEKHEGD